MPDEISRLIQDFARPQTAADWKRGSYMRRTQVGYAELYWKTWKGFWYEFHHDDEEVRAHFYLYGWTTGRVCGVNLLLRLVETAPFQFTRQIFQAMTTRDNLKFLVREINYYDPDVHVGCNKAGVFAWLFM